MELCASIARRRFVLDCGRICRMNQTFGFCTGSVVLRARDITAFKSYISRSALEGQHCKFSSALSSTPTKERVSHSFILSSLISSSDKRKGVTLRT